MSATTENYVREVIHAFNESGFAALNRPTGPLHAAAVLLGLGTTDTVWTYEGETLGFLALHQPWTCNYSAIAEFRCSPTACWQHYRTPLIEPSR